MTMSADRAPLHQQQAPPLVEAVGATAAPKSTPTPRWVPGLLTAFTAIALAVRGPPPVIDKNAYFLSLSAAFFARVAGVMAAVAARLGGGWGVGVLGPPPPPPPRQHRLVVAVVTGGKLICMSPLCCSLHEGTASTN
jgi:hypothetical protein